MIVQHYSASSETEGTRVSVVSLLYPCDLPFTLHATLFRPHKLWLTGKQGYTDLRNHAFDVFL